VPLSFTLDAPGILARSMAMKVSASPRSIPISATDSLSFAAARKPVFAKLRPHIGPALFLQLHYAHDTRLHYFRLCN
jgi:hypothetical protein